ncbi:hypothetical protein FOIG_11858 [Fusarium odoratissimum NRRL 54006]|uniref:Splicing factor 1 helix-hairpin domain-containing protein n=2 Tax=Fusarium oxysporum species complex TaxID=171631 RepID=X0JHF2_FUSO5|nr:uncharacterized protein FOIG_11858 [Fusarium odoratissimum NRRL 54006]EXL95791.1 hypothetical protein FOIG_11858 [Fusarium odoratissimum NRRL 54006]TXC11667.1 hypothetical protein FocTR4_00006800 [Fusarium oxysporum f. sp. cubense]
MSGKHQRANRWHEEASCAPTGFVTSIRSPMTSEQLDAYIMGFRIAEITDQLRTNDLNHTSGTSTRCLSPTPEYDNAGRRTNSRKQRYRKQLERERESNWCRLL